MPFQAGRRGEKVRGDCWLGFTPAETGGLELDCASKVEPMYGEATRQLLRGACTEAGVEHGLLRVVDQGAYPFILRARAESLLRRVIGQDDFMLDPEPSLGGAWEPSSRERRRQTRLYLPGNEAKYMLNAARHAPDGVILDLEDSVAPAAKADARSMVRHALHTLDWGDCERMVRLNQGAMGLADLEALADAPYDLLLLPKVEAPSEIAAIEAALGDRPAWIMPILETALGIENAFAIAQASQRTVALTLGLEDLTADLGVAKTKGGEETLWARTRVVNAARAAGLQAIDSVYGDVGDEEGLRQSVRQARALGFEGKGCVHPRQIATVHQAFAPSAEEVSKACRIVRAFEMAEAQGLGVVSLGSKMIDPPVVKRAQRTVEEALGAGLLNPQWRELEEEA